MNSASPTPPHLHSHIDAAGCQEGPERGMPHLQSLGRRGLRKLAGAEWPGHCGPASGREHAQAAAKCARAEARRSAAEGTRSRRPLAALPRSRCHQILPCTFGPTGFRANMCLIISGVAFLLSARVAALTKSKQASHGADLPRCIHTRSLSGRLSSYGRPVQPSNRSKSLGRNPWCVNTMLRGTHGNQLPWYRA